MLKPVARKILKNLMTGTSVLTLLAAGTLSGCLNDKMPDAKYAVRGASRALMGTEGLEGFKQTVFPYIATNCATCHSGKQTPLFATPDAIWDFNTVLDVPLVDFSSINSSRLVTQADDVHCGDPNLCSGKGKQMATLIAAWLASIQSAGGDVPGGGNGNIFTHQIPVPPPRPGCALPQDLACSPDIKVPRTDASGNILCANKCWEKMRFPVSRMVVAKGLPDAQNPLKDPKLQRAWLEVDFSYENYASALGIASYVIRNPRLMSPDSPVYVQDIGMFVNGTYMPGYGQPWHTIDTAISAANFNVSSCKPLPAFPNPINFSNLDADANGSCVPTTPPLFSTAASASDILAVSTDPLKPDTISFSFGYLQTGNLGSCSDMSFWLSQVYKPIVRGAVNCLQCHKPAGAVTEAGQRFDMFAQKYVTYFDAPPSGTADTYRALTYSQLATATLDGALVQQQLMTVCQRFLQRSNLKMPSTSPIIVQPIQGLNGMPAQPNFSYYDTQEFWLGWIDREARAAGINPNY